MLILALGMMTYSGYELVDICSEYAAGSEIYRDFANQFVSSDICGEKVVASYDLSPRLKEMVPISVDFDSLLKENKDIVGWIYSQDTPINYPVVQSTDNNYYLRRLLDGSYNIAGTIFMDCQNSPDLTDLNTIIYGHNMKNNTMFGTLQKYMDQEYYEKHPIIYYITPQQGYKVELIGGYVTDITSDIYKIPLKKEEQGALFEEIVEQSAFVTNTSFREGNRLITLSTCSYEYDTARFVLVGKIVDI